MKPNFLIIQSKDPGISVLGLTKLWHTLASEVARTRPTQVSMWLTIAW